MHVAGDGRLLGKAAWGALPLDTAGNNAAAAEQRVQTWLGTWARSCPSWSPEGGVVAVAAVPVSAVVGVAGVGDLVIDMLVMGFPMMTALSGCDRTAAGAAGGDDVVAARGGEVLVVAAAVAATVVVSCRAPTKASVYVLPADSTTGPHAVRPLLRVPCAEHYRQRCCCCPPPPAVVAAAGAEAYAV